MSISLLPRMDRTWTYLSLAHLVGSMSTCTRAHHGVVAFRDGYIVGAGYNGSPEGEPHCCDVGCTTTSETTGPNKGVDGKHCQHTIHAEINCIVTAARLGVSLQGTQWYMTGLPCWPCAKALSRLRLHSLHCVRHYAYDGWENSINLLMRHGVIVNVYPPEQIASPRSVSAGSFDIWMQFYERMIDADGNARKSRKSRKSSSRTRRSVS